MSKYALGSLLLIVVSTLVGDVRVGFADERHIQYPTEIEVSDEVGDPIITAECVERALTGLFDVDYLVLQSRGTSGFSQSRFSFYDVPFTSQVDTLGGGVPIKLAVAIEQVVFGPSVRDLASDYATASIFGGLGLDSVAAQLHDTMAYVQFRVSLDIDGSQSQENIVVFGFMKSDIESTSRAEALASACAHAAWKTGCRLVTVLEDKFGLPIQSESRTEDEYELRVHIEDMIAGLAGLASQP